MTTKHAQKDVQTASFVFACEKKGNNRCKIWKKASLGCSTRNFWPSWFDSPKQTITCLSSTQTPLRSIPVRQQHIILQVDCKNQQTQFSPTNFYNSQDKTLPYWARNPIWIARQWPTLRKVGNPDMQTNAPLLKGITIIHTTPAQCHIRFATWFGWCDCRRHAESEYLMCAMHHNFSESEGASTIRSLLCGRAPAWNCPWSSLNPTSSAIARGLPFQNGLWVLHSHPHPKEIQLDDFSSVCFIQLFRNTTQTPIIMRCLCVNMLAFTHAQTLWMQQSVVVRM